jgi:hypothetical protein
MKQQYEADQALAALNLQKTICSYTIRLRRCNFPHKRCCSIRYSRQGVGPQANAIRLLRFIATPFIATQFYKT